ncbi:hypothetical protein C8Q75DRAFT_737803 [Abortiporus biennis]|nr:hypothetical protein C8Q75DRAFT_737803 [Abortiporus biennis]
MAKILQIQQVVNAIQPANSKLVITKDQKTYMQKLAINMLLCPSLSSYRDTVMSISLILKSMGKLILAEDGTKHCVEALNIICMWVSFLVLLDDPSASYWITVDKKLAEIRTAYPDATECSNLMLDVLHEDYETFGVALADDLEDVTPLQSQKEANLFAQH